MKKIETSKHYLSERVISLIKQAIADTRGSRAAFARMSGIKPYNLSKILSGGKKFVFGDDWNKLCDVFPEIDDRPTSNAQIISMSDLVSVPVYTLAQAAEALAHPFGTGTELDDGETAIFSAPEEGDFAVKVAGLSMMPWYPPGTTVLVSRNEKPKTGDRVIVQLADNAEPFFKIWVDLGGEIALLSINSKDGREPIILDKLDKGETWYWAYPIKESLRNERDVDAAMSKAGIRHFWQDWQENYQKGEVEK